MKGKRKSYLLRIDEDLWNELNEWAGQEFRSVNGQIELILKVPSMSAKQPWTKISERNRPRGKLKA